MKKSLNYLLAVAAAIALTTGISRGGDRDDHGGGKPDSHGRCHGKNETLRGTGGVITGFLETKDVGGNFIPLPDNAPDSALLWGAHGGHTMLYAPDGHQLMWGEYKNAKASASATCTEIPGLGDGTTVGIRASGLIPGGVYTIWVLVFNGPFPSADPNNPFANMVGGGALGVNDGRANSFQASANGKGEINTLMPPGITAAIPYDIAGCLLDEVEFHLVGVYHSDGKTYGPMPGYGNNAEMQFGVQMIP